MYIRPISSRLLSYSLHINARLSQNIQSSLKDLRNIMYNQYIIMFEYYYVYIVLIKWECIKSMYSASSTTIDLLILGPPALVTVTIFPIATTVPTISKKIVIKTMQINYSIISNLVYTFYRNTYQHNHCRGTHFLYQEYARMAH